MIKSIKPVCIFLFLFCSLSLISQVKVTSNSVVRIGKETSVFSDSTRTLSSSAVLKKSFTKVTQDVPNLGVTKANVWATFKILNSTETEQLAVEIAHSGLKSVELFTVIENVPHSVGLISDSNEFARRPIDSQFFVFPIEVGVGEELDILVKITGDIQIMLPINVGSRQDILSANSWNDTFFGVYAGILLVMILYNLILWLSTRDRAYVAIVFYITCVFLAQANFQGYGFRYFWPTLPAINQLAVYILSGLVGIAAWNFFDKFTEASGTFPRIKIFYFAISVVYLIGIVFAIFEIHQIAYNLILASAFILALTLLATAVALMRKGNRQAKFYFVADVIVLCSVFIFIMKDTAVLPFNRFTQFSISIGSAIEVILLSIALADRINTLKKEKEESQAQALEALQENERMVREQNVILERRVEERTSALQQSNNDLGIAIDDLQQTQAQLVDAEKMASLGQMTAGIAHELNNPINFVSSNISPLKRDVQDVFEVIDLYGEMDESNFGAKLAEVNSLKEEIELDYVRTEIDQLLNGIADGAERTAEIVKGLRVFSRLDEDALKMADINECLESTLVILRSNFKNKCVIETSYDENIKEIHCFPGKLNQVFMNILNNAVQATTYTDKAVEDRLVSVSTALVDDNVVVSIKDNGNGIKPEDQSKSFDPFFTTKKVGEGTGLGLSIALGIVNDHKGSIKVNSTSGIGSEFILTLPTNL